MLRRLREQPSKFISKIEVTMTDGAMMDERWFDDIQIDLNPGLMAIIGNKGNGKSAIADIIGLCASTHIDSNNWSFLTKNKFCSPKPYDRSKQTKARITWEDKTDSGWITLDSSVDTVNPELVKYIPQNFLENLCTNEDDRDFEEEIKKIIFQHIPNAERYGKGNLDEIIDYLSTAARNDGEFIKNKITEVNRSIIALEDITTITIKYENSINYRCNRSGWKFLGRILARKRLRCSWHDPSFIHRLS